MNKLAYFKNNIMYSKCKKKNYTNINKNVKLILLRYEYFKYFEFFSFFSFYSHFHIYCIAEVKDNNNKTC